MMTDSNIQPYRGDEPYAFISYAHRNKAEVLTIIGRMQAEGCRIWYDEGIDPGTEWAEHIAQQLIGCDYFIAFLSPEYLASANCLDELSFARDRKKECLLVYLNNVTIPDGIHMRANRLQAVRKYAYRQEESFYRQLFQAKEISRCMPSGASSPAASGIRRKLPFLAGAAAVVCVLLTALVFFRFNGRGMGKEQQEALALALDPADLSGLSFGMSPEDVREIMIAAGSRAKSTYYSDEGIPIMEYIPSGRNYAGAAEGSVSVEQFNGKEVQLLDVSFDAEGLCMLYYQLDASQDPDRSAFLKTLSDKYGKPDSAYPSFENPSFYGWNLDNDVSFDYFPCLDAKSDVVLISVSYNFYLDMRSFSWGMSPEEALEAEATEISPLKLKESGVDALGYPYQYYEGKWNVGIHPAGRLALGYADNQLILMQYPLLKGSFEQVVADLDVLYGENARSAVAEDGSVAWRIAGYQDRNNTPIPITISATRVEEGVLITLIDVNRYQSLIGN
nr:toll/interleukin-1 receptor domain-containing protein [uncultured Acetatifactor sp.]